METTQYTTFWKFLSNQRIEIPIIQRDYAQGRSGQEKLREKFLKDLKFALDNPEQKLKLDFVYGSLEDEKLQPLDGQQRLTTLWLLHWFIAYKAGKLTKNTVMFKKFSYETRTSSREFCNKLSEFNIKQPVVNTIEVGLVEHIQNQTWFYSAWKQDPTIQAMLNMLGGTDEKDKEDKDIIDGIEELFKDKFEEYWDVLTRETSPIIFYYMPLSELKLSDDLYIKMNARGKPLTSFENFKADLTGFLKRIKEENANNEIWKTFDVNDFEHKLDTDWTDIFWKSRSNGYKIDEIYFAFFNRYFFKCLVTTANVKEDNKSFKFLYGKESDDSSIIFSGFEIYKPIAENPITFSRLSEILNNFNAAFKELDKDQINSLFTPNWKIKNDFKFIPEYEDEESITTLTQKQRVVFHAICCYFENNKYEEGSFKRWMRVVWNIVENSNVATVDTMIKAIRLIDELGKHSNNIYTHLKDREISEDFAKDQMEEEKEKARQIIDNPEWEGKIIEAEKTAFFNGAIRFLFRTDADKYDWSLFDARMEKTKLYFDSKGVCEEYFKDATLLRFFISKFNKWEHLYPWDNHKTQLFYDNHYQNWKNLLTHRAYISPTNAFFDIDIKSFDSNSFNSSFNDKVRLLHNDIVKTSILSKIETGCTFHFWNHGGCYSLYPYNTKSQSKIYVLADIRNEVISKLEKENVIKVEEWQKIYGLPFYKGWDIEFQLTKSTSNIKFQWNKDNKIYVLENGDRKKKTVGNDYEMFDGDLTTPEPYKKLQDWMKQICGQN